MRLSDIFKPDPKHQKVLENLARQHFPTHGCEITWRVLAIVSEQLGVEPEKLRPETQFVRDLNANDLDPVELIMAIEQEFSFKIPRQEAENLLTVSHLIDYVRQRKL
jgi:acyl carrier protein